MNLLLIKIFLILPPEYTWLESYLDNDSLWLEDSLNWEEAFDLILSDFTIYTFLTTPFFLNSHFFLDSFVKFSFLDVMLMTETNKLFESRQLFDLFIWDMLSLIYNNFLPLQFLFYTDYQDFLMVIVHYSPELILALTEYLNAYWISNVLSYAPAAVFDLFTDSLTSTVSEFLEYFVLFFIFAWLVVLFVNTYHLIKWNNPLDIYLTRIYNYIYSTSRELRIQFEVLLQVFFFFFFYWSMMIATFDDDQEELIELFDVSCFYFFCAVVAYLFYKYSVHYFAFLEASVTEGRSVAFITKQFFRDFINTFALFLRFFILLFRLNVYDTLDDFYDSYYIFVGDFDDDEYFSELFFPVYSLLFYDQDVNDDRIYSLEEENDFFLDLFYIYFLIWGKFFTFIFFILEEILRLALGFYICYLITFEVHAVNASYVEDSYAFNTRSKLENLADNDPTHVAFKS